MTTTGPSTTVVHTTIDSPLGPLRLVAADGALAGLYMNEQRHLPVPERFGEAVAAGSPVFADAVAQLAEYFAGDRATFDLVLRPHGTPFQQAVWEQLRTIPFGVTTTYGAIVAALEERGDASPGAFRAVGAAVGRNPIGLIVPCHRVIGSDGRLTGYAGGLDRKVWLLTHEGVLV